MLDKRISTPKRSTSLDPSIAAEHIHVERGTHSDMQLFPLQTSVNFQFTLKLVVKSAPSVPYQQGTCVEL